MSDEEKTIPQTEPKARRQTSAPESLEQQAERGRTCLGRSRTTRGAR